MCDTAMKIIRLMYERNVHIVHYLPIAICNSFIGMLKIIQFVFAWAMHSKDGLDFVYYAQFNDIALPLNLFGKSVVFVLYTYI